MSVRADGTSLAHETTLSSSRGSRERLLSLKAIGQKGQALFTTPNFLLVVAGFLLGRAAVLEEIAPFGAVFWLAVLREKPRQSFLVAAAVLTGRATIESVPAALYLLGAMAAVWLLEGLCLRLAKRRLPLLLATAVLVVLSHNLAVISSFTLLEFIYLGLEIAIGCLAAVVMQPGLRLIKYLPYSRDRPGLASEETVALFLLCILTMFGLKGLAVAGLSVEAVVSLLSLLLAACLLGAGWGAAMGIITGTILGLGNPLFYLIIGSLSFCGFWAGLLKPFGKWGCAAGYFFAIPILFLLAAGDLSGMYWREGLLSIILFLLIPQRFLAKLPLQLQKLGLTGCGEAEEKSRLMVSERIKQFAALCKELSLGFSQTSAGKQAQVENELTPLLETLMNRVCRSCLFRRRCWEKDRFSHHRLVLDLLARAETDGEVAVAHLSPTFRERCQQPEAFVRAINNLQEVWELNRFWEEKVREGKELVSGQLEGLAQVMLDLADQVDANRFPPDVGEQAPLFHLEIGVAQRAGRCQQVCGDCYSLLDLGIREQVIILSDGMGNGPRAAEESKATAAMLERLLEAGFPKEVVIRSVNSLLQLRAGDETFATVDMALINLVEGEVELLKIGAAPSFLKRGRDVYKIGASSLPLGILANIEMERYREKLHADDLLVMVTDGICDPDGEIPWLPSYLKQMESSPSQIVADRILDETIRRNGNPLRDDLTVVTCRPLRLKRDR
ncbi:MAG: SpoIIE family protein phosphatase [Firmicutes bacterium]|jgi:stage II sporulation protein E|nr:SpoIIE family protein phosphatase [Bacillota bacterium]